MKPKDPRDDYREPSYGFAGVQERADELLQVALDLSEAEVDRIYVAAHLAQNLNEKLFGLASRAAAVCHAEHRPRPALQAALAVFAQMELPLENKQSPILPRILLIDSDAERLLERRRVFSERQIETDITTSASDGVARLQLETFRLVIVDFSAKTEMERTDLLALQRFNVKVPIVNVSAWATFTDADNRLINRELLRAVTRLFGKTVPKRLPKKRPPNAARGLKPDVKLFDAG